MKITYDPEVDALYIRFSETTITTEHLSEGLAADFDALSRLAGIEVPGIFETLGPSARKQVTLEGLGPAQLS